MEGLGEEPRVDVMAEGSREHSSLEISKDRRSEMIPWKYGELLVSFL